MAKKKIATVAIRVGYGVLGLCVLFAAGWFIPFPIEGNWQPPLVSCACDSHKFMRFEDGKILNMSEHHLPCEWFGTYRRSGWGKYEIQWFPDETNFPLFVRSTVLQAKWEFPQQDAPDDFWERRLTRDPFVLTCRRVVNDPANDWLDSPQWFSYRVTGTADERLFVRGETKQTKEEIEARLNNWLHPRPLQLYTASDEAPSCVIDILVQNGFGYDVHPRQQWIETEWVNDPSLPRWKRDRPPDSEDANPLWTNKAFQLIIRMPPGEEENEEPKVSFRGGAMKKLSEFKHAIERSKRDLDKLKNLYLYAEDGILPEDVRQMLEPFGLDYQVLDEQILFRGKRRASSRLKPTEIEPVESEGV